jgi:VanZ family protein
VNRSRINLSRIEWAIGYLLVVVAIAVCLAPRDDLPESVEHFDKLSHVLGHGALAAYFAGLVPRSAWWKIFLFLLALGIGIEFAQHFIHMGREGDPRDVVANSAGAVLGLLAGRLGVARWPELVSWLATRRGATP